MDSVGHIGRGVELGNMVEEVGRVGGDAIEVERTIEDLLVVGRPVERIILEVERTAEDLLVVGRAVESIILEVERTVEVVGRTGEDIILEVGWIDVNTGLGMLEVTVIRSVEVLMGTGVTS